MCLHEKPHINPAAPMARPIDRLLYQFHFYKRPSFSIMDWKGHHMIRDNFNSTTQGTSVPGNQNPVRMSPRYQYDPSLPGFSPVQVMGYFSGFSNGPAHSPFSKLSLHVLPSPHGPTESCCGCTCTTTGSASALLNRYQYHPGITGLSAVKTNLQAGSFSAAPHS